MNGLHELLEDFFKTTVVLVFLYQRPFDHGGEILENANVKELNGLEM